MPSIHWEGNQDWGKDYPEVAIPDHAVKIESRGGSLDGSLPYGILPMLFCFACLFLKVKAFGEFPLDKPYALAGIVLGLCLLPVHELLHAVCCPPGAEVYCGISIRKFAAFCVCHYPMTRRRFIVMSLLPAVLGLIPLILFLIFPISWKIPSAVCWPAAMIGLMSPMPDYKDVHNVLRQVPPGAMIQSCNHGWYWFKQNTNH